METDTHRARGRHKPAMRCTPCGVTASLRGVRRCRGASKLSPAMKPDPKDPLAVWADQALRQLPARRAPDRGRRPRPEGARIDPDSVVIRQRRGPRMAGRDRRTYVVGAMGGAIYALCSSLARNGYFLFRALCLPLLVLRL